MFEETAEKNKAISMEDYWALLRRRRWFLLGPFFLGWAVVWAVSWILPASYRSETVILVERQKVPEQYVVPNVAVDLQERLQSMTQQILSRTRLQKIIDDFHLYSAERSRLGPDQVIEKMRNDISIELVEAPGHRGELTAFKIDYSAASPQLAQQVTSELTSLFIDENLRARSQQSESTTAFLTTQLNDARKNLEEQEEKLRQYKSEYLGQLPEQLQSNVQILAGLQGQLQAAQQALHQAQQQKIYLDSMESHYRSLSSGVTSGGTQGETTEQELQRLKAQLADYSARYTDTHPDVMHLKEQIARLEKVKKAEDAAAAKENSGDAHPNTFSELQAMSPMMQVEGQIKANDLEIQNREREVRDLQGKVDGYQGRLNLTPLREQQLSDLTRDHDQALNNYQSLLAKQMQSSLATNLEKRQEGEQFSIIDPPSLPRRPYWPNRLNFSFLGLAVGIGLGIGTVVVTEVLQNRIRGESELAQMTAIPILAGIPLIVAPSQLHKLQRRKIIEAFYAVAIGAVMVMGNVFSYYKG